MTPEWALERVLWASVEVTGQASGLSAREKQRVGGVRCSGAYAVNEGQCGRDYQDTMELPPPDYFVSAAPYCQLSVFARTILS
jgi:hypothetical protein